MISSPGCAGRQCSAIAPRRRAVEQRVVDAVGRQRGAALVGRRPRRPSTPRRRCRRRRRRRPPRAGSVGQRRAGDRLELRSPSGEATRTSTPASAPSDRQRARDVVAVADVGELAGPRARRSASRSVSRSASAWHGWWPAVSMLKTGHRGVRGELLELRRRARAHADRRDVAREHERGVADRLAARRAASRPGAGPSGGRRARRCRPRTTSRVRVDGFSKISATVRPLERVARSSGAAFSSAARSSSATQLVGVELGAGEEVAGQGGSIRRRCAS